MAAIYGGNVLADVSAEVFDPDGLADIESVTVRPPEIPIIPFMIMELTATSLYTMATTP